MPEIIENLVSTIIPVYNRPVMLQSCVESVLAQTHRPIEIIISDDGSSDETPDVAQKLVDSHPGEVRLVRNQNQGAGPAREAGRQISKGEFIQYLDSDDRLWPGKFEAQVAALRAHPECGVAYGRTRLLNEEGEVLADPFKWTGRELPTLFPWLLVDRWWCTHTPLYRRTVCDAVGSWTDLRYSQDWEYDGRVGALGTRLVFCDETVSDHYSHVGKRQTGSGKWLGPEGRVRFLSLMQSYAKQAGVATGTLEMKHFSRWAFANARECGALGDAEAAKACLKIAIEAADEDNRDTRLYRILANVFGWKWMGMVSIYLIKHIKFRSGPFTQKQSWM